MEKEITYKQLLTKLKALGVITKEQRRRMTCSLIGHSRIQTACFGYYSCGRCEMQLGDSLGGAYSAKTIVIVGHECPTCRKNYETCTWRDKLYCLNPFPKKK